MFNRVLVFLAIGLVLASQAAAQQAAPPTGQVKVPRGTILSFETLEALDSTTAKVGDDIPLRLVSPLIVDGIALLPAGEVVHGKVTKVKRAGPKGRNGEVDWKFNRIKFADGTTAKVNVGYIGDFTNWDVFWLIVIFAPILPFVLLEWAFRSHGDKQPRSLAPGKEFLQPANSPQPITITKDHHVRF